MKNIKSVIEKLVSQAQEQQVQRFVVGAVIEANDKVLCLKRASDDFMPGLYELPSGKVEDGESMLDALKRETKEELERLAEELKDSICNVEIRPVQGSTEPKMPMNVFVNMKELV